MELKRLLYLATTLSSCQMLVLGASPGHNEMNSSVNNSSLHNWAWSYEFNVSKVVKATSIEQVASIVRDVKKYPSPVRALGSTHSVTECVVSNGTIIDIRGLDNIKGLHVDEREQQVVIAQAGVKLIDLHKWLGNHNLELAFSAEIGDATIGSLASSISKDSGLGNMTQSGTLYKSIVSLTYVSHTGKVVTLTEKSEPASLASFKSSDGMLGIVVEMGLLCRPSKLVTFSDYIMPTQDILTSFKNGSFTVTEDKNFWILLTPKYSMVQERTLAQSGVNESDAKTIELIANVTRANFGKGMLSNLNAKGAEQKPIIWTTFRRNMVNHYEPADKNATRLDFTWFEYPYDRFQDIVPAYMKFWNDFRDANGGFEPTGAATYFVYRIPDKPSGWFSQTGEGFDTPGLSFTLDPIYHDPNDAVWEKFLKESVTFAHANGGRMALTQTRLLTPEDYLSCPGNAPVPDTPNRRFTSAFFQRFMKTSPLPLSINATITVVKPSKMRKA